MVENFTLTMDVNTADMCNGISLSAVDVDCDVIGQVISEMGEPDLPPIGYMPISILLGGHRLHDELKADSTSLRACMDAEKTDLGIARNIKLPLLVSDASPEPSSYLIDEVEVNRALLHELRHAVDLADDGQRAEQSQFIRDLIGKNVSKKETTHLLRTYGIHGVSALSIVGAALLYRRNRNPWGPLALSAGSIIADKIGISHEKGRLADSLQVERVLSEIRPEIQLNSPFELRAKAEADQYDDDTIPRMIIFEQPEAEEMIRLLALRGVKLRRYDEQS